MSAVVEHLKRVKEVLSSPDKWNQGGYASTAEGDAVYWDNPEAVCFCFAGASRKAAGAYTSAWDSRSEAIRLHNDATTAILDCVNQTKGSHLKSIATWNDDPKTTYKDVIATIDLTIERLS